MRTHKRIVVIAVALVALFAIFSLVWFSEYKSGTVPMWKGWREFTPKPMF